MDTRADIAYISHIDCQHAYRSLRHNLLFERLKSPDQTAVMKITLLNVKEHNLICLTRRRLQHIKFSPGNMS